MTIDNSIRIGTILYGFDISPKRLSNSPKNILRKIRNNYLIKKYKISKTYDDVNIELKPALKLKTNIIQIKHIKKGDKVVYQSPEAGTYVEEGSTIMLMLK